MVEKIQLALWVLVPAVQVCIAVMMVQKRLIRELPWFFSYTVYRIASFAVLFTAYQLSYSAYFYLFWTVDAIDALFALAVIQEIYVQAFRPFDALKNFSVLLFKWAAVLLVVLAIAVAFTNNGTESNRFIAGLLILDRSAGFVQCGLLFLVFLIKQTVGLHWRRLTTAVALGMGVASASSTIGYTLRAYSSGVQDEILGLALTAFYNVAVFIWVFAVLKPEPQLDMTVLPPEDQLRRWNSALLEIMGR